MPYLAALHRQETGPCTEQFKNSRRNAIHPRIPNQSILWSSQSLLARIQISNIRREVSNWLEERPARFETAGEPVAIASHNELYSSDDRQGQSGLDFDAAPGRRM